MHVCVYVCVCVCEFVRIRARTGGGGGGEGPNHDTTCYILHNVTLSQKSAKLCLYVCLCVVLAYLCVVCTFVYVCVCVCYACLFVCVAETRQDPFSLGNKSFAKRDCVPYLYHVEHGYNSDLTIV